MDFKYTDTDISWKHAAQESWCGYTDIRRRRLQHMESITRDNRGHFIKHQLIMKTL